jgi:NAD(P)-dependent dehydrogenase (short-subunit alcohol dehydrogenase family)
MTKPESRLVVVITGASSGVGFAIALAFARQQALLVLASRNEIGLAKAAAECRQAGAEVIFQSTDVTDFEALARLRERAVEAYGRIDIWVNCAAVLLFGRFEDTPLEAFRRVIETNVLGYANGARAAILQFRAQGCGTLINVSSVLNLVGEPYASAYVTSKFAIMGLTTCLRQEASDVPDIRICAVLPPAVDTPIYQHAGNYMGRVARSIFPVYTADKVAKAVVRLARKPKREVVIGVFGRLITFAVKFAPGITEQAVARIGPRLQFTEQLCPPTNGNVLESTGLGYKISGGWLTYWKKLIFKRKPATLPSGARL